MSKPATGRTKDGRVRVVATGDTTTDRQKAQAMEMLLNWYAETPEGKKAIKKLAPKIFNRLMKLKLKESPR